MPGFVKTPKDEAKWSKAKEAASKSTKSGSESYWKLANYIFHHKMGKSENLTDNSPSIFIKSEGFDQIKHPSVRKLRDFLMTVKPGHNLK